MFSLLPMSLWYSAESQARGTGIKYHFLQIFITNSIEFLKNLIRKNSIDGIKGLLNRKTKSVKNLSLLAFVPTFPNFV